jgi:hypothetical protein
MPLVLNIVRQVTTNSLPDRFTTWNSSMPMSRWTLPVGRTEIGFEGLTGRRTKPKQPKAAVSKMPNRYDGFMVLDDA